MVFRIGMVGLDTSHSVEFPRLFQSEVSGERLVDGLRVISCLRFPSAFCTEEVQNERQEQVGKWGVKVTRNFEEVAEGVDGFMIEINDPALHLQYFKQAVKYGKPIFLDKPLASTLEEGEEIFRLAQEAGIPFWSSSSLRFNESVQTIAALPTASCRCAITAPVGKAASGSDLVWYGVHGVEMLVTIMGTGAKSVFTHENLNGFFIAIDYGNGRGGQIELTRLDWSYSGNASNEKKLHQFSVTPGTYYLPQMQAMKAFFLDGVIPVAREQTLLVQAILDAADRSRHSGKAITL